MAKLEISPEIIEALQKLSSLLESDDAFARTLQTVVDLSVSTVPGCDSAGVTIRNGKDRTAAATDSYTLELDQIQYDTGEGPCLTTINTSEPHHIDNLEEDPRWPEFAHRATKHGLRSSASFPLLVKDSMGALNLYARTPQAFDEASLALGEVFARQASIALANAQIYGAARALERHLLEALKTRDLIGQAKGILMEREGLTDPEAFELLKRVSQNENVKLRDVAQRVVDEKARESASKDRAETGPGG